MLLAGCTAHASAPSDVRIRAASGVPASTLQRVRGTVFRARRAVDRDFPPHGDGILTIRLFATQVAFARALRRQQGIAPQGPSDALGNVTYGTLLLGPPNALFRHNLAHVYTEWVLDLLTHNRSDRQPDPAWLYDGIAEWEASRVAGSLPCSIPGAFPLPLHSLVTARQWLSVRGTVNGGLEYCEAQLAAGRLIHRVGWTRVRFLLAHSGSWAGFAANLLARQSQRE